MSLKTRRGAGQPSTVADRPRVNPRCRPARSMPGGARALPSGPSDTVAVGHPPGPPHTWLSPLVLVACYTIIQPAETVCMRGANVASDTLELMRCAGRGGQRPPGSTDTWSHRAGAACPVMGN